MRPNSLPDQSERLLRHARYLRSLAGVCGNHPSCDSTPCIHSGLDGLIDGPLGDVMAQGSELSRLADTLGDLIGRVHRLPPAQVAMVLGPMRASPDEKGQS